jgi:hypothetical protein
MKRKEEENDPKWLVNGEDATLGNRENWSPGAIQLYCTVLYCIVLNCIVLKKMTPGWVVDGERYHAGQLGKIGHPAPKRKEKKRKEKKRKEKKRKEKKRKEKKRKEKKRKEMYPLFHGRNCRCLDEFLGVKCI